MPCLQRMQFPMFPDETKDFLSTVKVEYKDRKEKKASEGLVTFKIKNRGYGLTIFDICECFDFKKGEAVKFDDFISVDHVWDTIAAGPYQSNRAKMSAVRNPAIWYVCKLLANTFLARKDAGSVTMKELCLIYQGIKHLLTDRRGTVLSYDFGDEINYGSIFAAELAHIPRWVHTTTEPDLYIGAMLTPLFEKAGVDLSNSTRLPVMGYLGEDYLVSSRFLKSAGDTNQFLYKIKTRSTEDRILQLPRRDIANILSLSNVRFDVQEDEFLHMGQPEPEPEEDDVVAGGPNSWLQQLDAIQMPEIEFTPRTKREKLLKTAYKAQRKINELQKKLLNKLFRRVKKLQPPEYVSSEEDEGQEEAGQEDAGQEDDHSD